MPATPIPSRSCGPQQPTRSWKKSASRMAVETNPRDGYPRSMACVPGLGEPRPAPSGPPPQTAVTRRLRARAGMCRGGPGSRLALTRRLAKRRLSTLEVEQQALALQPAAVAGESSARSDHTVARDDYRDRIPRIGHPHGTGRRRIADATSYLAVAGRVSVGDALQLMPYPSLERGPSHGERHVVEHRTFSGEVLP